MFWHNLVDRVPLGEVLGMLGGHERLHGEPLTAQLGDASCSYVSLAVRSMQSFSPLNDLIQSVLANTLHVAP